MSGPIARLIGNGNRVVLEYARITKHFLTGYSRSRHSKTFESYQSPRGQMAYGG